jgi:hypothetical protein
MERRISMISELLVLIGLAFFIKLFFDGAKKLVSGTNGDVVKSKTYWIHGGLGVAFLIVARLITILL